MVPSAFASVSELRAALRPSSRAPSMEPDVSIWKNMFAGFLTSDTQLFRSVRTVSRRLGKGISKAATASSADVASVRRYVSSAILAWTSLRRR